MEPHNHARLRWGGQLFLRATRKDEEGDRRRCDRAFQQRFRQPIARVGEHGLSVHTLGNHELRLEQLAHTRWRSEGRGPVGKEGGEVLAQIGHRLGLLGRPRRTGGVGGGGHG